MVARPHGKSAGLGGRPGGGWRLAGTSAGFRPRFRVGVLAIASAALAAAGAATSAQAKRIQQAPSRGSLGRRLTLDEVLNNMRMRANTLFDKLDFNSNGYIDVVELQEFGTSLPGSSGYKSGTKLLMESRAAGIPVEFLATVLENGDEDGDGFISREEFVDYMLESEKLLKQAFDQMDIDGSGLLSKDEVELAMRNLEVPCGGNVVKRVMPSAANKLVEEMGVSDTHEVDYEEFRWGVVTLARKDLSAVNSYWSKCYVAGPYGNSGLDAGAGRTSNITGHLIAGFIAGVTAKTLTAPLEVVLRLIITGRVPPGSSIGRVFKLLVRDEGIRGLFKGNLANVAKTPPTRFLELGFLQIFSEMLVQPDDISGGMSRTNLSSPLAGAFAGACAMVILYPLDTLSVRLSVTKNVYKNIGDAFRRTVTLETPRALFSGVIPTILWAFPYMGIQYDILNRLERRYRNQQRDALRRGRKPPVIHDQLRLVVHGSIASTIAACICMPFETVRRRMQVQTIGGRQKIFGSAATAFGKLAAKDGFTSLYIGVEVLALKTIAYSALSFAAYEVAKAALIPILEPKTKEMETCAICSDENMT